MKFKKILSSIIAAAMILVLIPAMSVTVGASHDFTTADALAILRHAAGLTPLSAADIARLGITGEPSTSDALFVLRVVAGIINPDGTLVPVVNRRGNTSGNIANGGLAAIQGEWIY
jgi:uncharacterized membrane protein